MSTTERVVQRVRRTLENTVAGHMELDSHADSTVLGQNCVILSYSGRECDVRPYSDEYDAVQNIPVVTGATAWTSAETGETYILVFHEALWFGDRLDHSLINPNQLRHFGIDVVDNPYADTPMGIKLGDDDDDIPFTSKGTTIYFDSRTPTDAELQNCRHVHLTCQQPWDPHNVCFPNGSTRREEGEEQGFSSLTVAAIQRKERLQQSYDMGLDAGIRGTVDDPATLATRLIQSVKVSAVETNPDRMDDLPGPRTFISGKRKTSVDPRDLAERWGISLSKATQTLKVTTQRILRSALMPLARRYRADRMFERPRIRGTMYSDTYNGKHKSLDGNRYAQVFANESFFIAAYPMETKNMAGDALKQFISDYGVPDKLIVDGSKEQTKKKTEFYKQCRKHDIDLHRTEPYRHNQSKVEGVIRETRKRWFRIMVKSKVPRRLWDYGLVWVCNTSQLTASDAGFLKGRTALEEITGDTPDISEYLDFDFYAWVWYNDAKGGDNLKGRWLGVSHKVGSLMSYWILTEKGTVISRTTVWPMTNLELKEHDNRKSCDAFDAKIRERLQDDKHVIAENAKAQPNDWSAFNLDEDPDFREEFFDVVSSEDVVEADDYTPDVGDDSYLHMEVQIPRPGFEHPQRGRVTKRMRDEDGNPIGRADDKNILFDTRLYEVEFPDGEKLALSANYIAQNLFAQINDDGDRFILLKDIIDYRIKADAVKPEDAFITTRSGAKRRRTTTRGVELCCEFVDGMTQWVALKDMKESYPVEVAEYAVQARIDHLPAFAWWVPYVLKKREIIIAKVKSKYWERTHKYGIRIPKDVGEARRIDKDNGNTLWWDAICKEMKNVRVAFEKWEKGDGDDELPKGFQEIKCHMVFDVKLGENFRRKARMVAGGHKTDTPATLTYSSVVARDSVRICLMLAALNGLDVRTCDIQNAYLTAPCREKVWTYAGEEFGSEKGSIMIVVRALYGLKSSGAAFRAHLAERLYEMGFKPSKADPDVWMRPDVKEDKSEYYEYVLVYVDDCMAISMDAIGVLKEIQETFKLKGDKMEKPDMYLGARLEQMEAGVKTGLLAWCTSAEDFVKQAVEDVERELKAKGLSLPKKCDGPLPSGYQPEMDTSPELKRDGHTRYQELIGILRWACELGRVDIQQETSMMSSYLACPRQGHLERLYYIFGYLKRVPKRKLCLDPRYPNIAEDSFAEYDWEDFYRGAKEKIPHDAPKPRGRYVTTHCFVDANHAGCKKTRKSVTGVIIFVNSAPVIVYSKKQNTVEASTFGAEFVALRTAVELIEALRIKLRYFGVPVEGATDVFCDNESVFKNASTPESTLKKKHLGICYHRSREAVAAGVIRVAKEHTSTNLADLLTKSLPFDTRERLLDYFTY